MSVTLPKTRWLSIGAVFLVLVTILALLYVKRQYDESEYFESRALLSQLRQIDLHWELELLQAKTGVDTASPSDPLGTLRELAERAARLTKDQEDASEAATEAARKAIRDKTELAALVKSRYAQLRKSLALLPGAAVAAQRQIGNAAAFKNVDRGYMRNAADDLNRVLVQTILYSQAPSEERAGTLQAELAKLAGARPALPSEALEALDTFVGHVKAVLHEEGTIVELLARIAALPTGARINDLDKALNQQHRAVLAEQADLRRYSIGAAVLLALLVAYAAFYAVRNDASLTRLNRTLAEENESLQRQIGAPAQPAAPPSVAALAAPVIPREGTSAPVDPKIVQEIDARTRYVKGNLEIVARRVGDIADIEDLCGEVVQILSAQGARSMDLQTRLRRVYDVAHKIAGFKVSAEVAHRLRDGIRGVNQLSEALAPARAAQAVAPKQEPQAVAPKQEPQAVAPEQEPQAVAAA